MNYFYLSARWNYPRTVVIIRQHTRKVRETNLRLNRTRHKDGYHFEHWHRDSNSISFQNINVYQVSCSDW